MLFGDGLLGTLCASGEPNEAVPDDVGVLLFNAGVVHRVGPHRIHVKLARALAARGVPSIRFDTHGLGDSASAAGDLAYEDQIVADLRMAIDALQEARGVQRIAILGFCSGVMPSVHAALADARVVQIVLHDGLDVGTRGARLRHFLLRARALRPGIATRWLVRLGARIRALPGRSGRAERETGVGAPRPWAVAPLLSDLVSRGVDVVVMHAGSDHSEVNDHRQAQRAFQSAGARGLRFRFLDAADHVLTSIAAQRTFVECLCGIVGEAPRSVADSRDPVRQRGERA
jgi:dienelactone hydrolase